jgi:hypothetical protein
MIDNLDNVVVKKPWGYEYLCYKNKNLAIWFLHIVKNRSTSLHCHPKKHTSLIVLNGAVNVSFMRSSTFIKALDKIGIFRSRFHSTTALTDDTFLLEVETPEDKHDLVRLKDSYGRENKGYETQEHFTLKTTEELWINDPTFNSVQHHKNITFNHFIADERIKLFDEKDLMIVTEGGIVTDKNDQLVYPGDTIDGESLNTLSNSFILLPTTTLIHIKQ